MFQGDKKFGQSLLHKPEEALKRALLPLVPRWLETNHLTLMTLPWCGFILLFSYFARFNIHWLWGVSVMIAAQYVTDLLDGAIGRQRDTGLVKWGFYMDHFLDFVFLCALLIGYAILLPQMHRTALFFVMVLFAGFMVNSFLSFGATNRFQIAYMGMGPTEMRIVFIFINTLLVIFGTKPLVAALPYTLAAGAFGLFFTVYRTQQELWRADMAAKHGHEAVPAPPPSRHRLSFTAALVLGVAGGWLATLPTLEVPVRLASLTLLAVAVALFMISLRDFRRFKLRRRFFLAAFMSHLPYLLTGLLLLAALRTWFVLAPLGVDFPPPGEEVDVKELWNKYCAAADEMYPAIPLYTGGLAPLDNDDGQDGTRLWIKYRAVEKSLLDIEDCYRGFINIDSLSNPRGHADAFTIFFGAYALRCFLDIEMTKFLMENPALWQDLDPATKREAMRLIRMSSSDTVLIRLVCGSLYLRLHRGKVSENSLLPRFIETRLDELFTELPPLWWRSLKFWVLN